MAALLGLAAIAAPLVIADPAAADPAPAVTTDGIGIRVDETAIQGDVLEAIETALQPVVDQLIYDGGVDGAPLDNYIWLQVTNNLELSFDVLPPSGSRPDGGIAVHADIQNIQLEYRADPVWPFADCSIYIRPSNATIDATASVDRDALPATPLILDPIQATWDDDPDVSTTGVCWAYLIDNLFQGWWDSLWGNDPESTASKIEAQLNAQAQGLVDELWDQYVTPILGSLGDYGVSINQLHTDDHGLIVTANLDASNGLAIPGVPGGPIDVSGAEASGSVASVNDVLANRTTADGPAEIIVSVDPNIANQALYAIDGALNNYGQPSIDGAAIEELLVPPALRPALPDNSWSLRLLADAAPHVEPTGPAGAPQVQFSEVRLEFRSGPTLVSTFEGTLTGLDLITEVRPDGTWGPALATGNADLNVTQTFLHPLMENFPAPTSAQLLPFVVNAVERFNEDILLDFVSLAPVELFGFNVDLCTTCGRFTGDDRYTETFKVN